MKLVNALSGVLLFLLCIVAFVVVLVHFTQKEPVPVTDSYLLYRELKDPLIGTIQKHGRTLATDKQGSQVYEFMFNGYMTELPYRVIMSRNVDFEDCSVCIGNWDEGMLSPISYRDQFIPLDEFIIQMVYSKQNVFDTKNKQAPIQWDSGDYLWQVSIPDNKNLWHIQVWDKYFRREWGVYVPFRALHDIKRGVSSNISR